MAPVEEQIRAVAFEERKPEQMEKQMRLMGEGAAIARKVVTATEAAQRAVAAELPPEAAEKFADAFLRASNPRLFRTRHGERTADAALALLDLTAEQRDRLTALRDTHQAALKQLRPAAIKRQKAMEDFQAAMLAAKDHAERIKVSESMSELWQASDPMAEMRTKDNELIKQVRAVLTEEQRKQLPRRQSPNLPGAR
jgi:Spy/CpxP family protein refolding chaperone